MITGATIITEGLHSNGTLIHPAIITRTYDELPDGAVACNVCIFPDLSPPHWMSRVPVYASRERAAGCTAPVKGYWPPGSGAVARD